MANISSPLGSSLLLHLPGAQLQPRNLRHENSASASGDARMDLFRRANRLFERQTNEPLVGQTSARGPLPNRVEKLLGQTQIDGLIFTLDLKTDPLRSGKIVLRQVGPVDEGCRGTVALKGRDFLFRRHQSPF